MRSAIVGLFVCAVSASAFADRRSALSLPQIRAGMISRVREEAAKQPDPVERVHAHPAVQLLGWLRSTRLEIPAARREHGATWTRFQQGIGPDQRGRLSFRDELELTATQLRIAGLMTIEGVDDLMGQRFVASGREFDRSVKTMAEATGVLDRAARAQADKHRRGLHMFASPLRDAVLHGVANVDATLLAAMHRALSGPEAVVPLATQGSARLVLRPFSPTDYVWRGLPTTYPSLHLLDGDTKWVDDEAILARFGITQIDHLDRAIEAAMHDVAAEDF